jgi:hypothetical protein
MIIFNSYVRLPEGKHSVFLGKVNANGLKMTWPKHEWDDLSTKDMVLWPRMALLKKSRAAAYNTFCQPQLSKSWIPNNSETSQYTNHQWCWHIYLPFTCTVHKSVS